MQYSGTECPVYMMQGLHLYLTDGCFTFTSYNLTHTQTCSLKNSQFSI